MSIVSDQSKLVVLFNLGLITVLLFQSQVQPIQRGPHYCVPNGTLISIHRRKPCSVNIPNPKLHPEKKAGEKASSVSMTFREELEGS